MIKGSDLLESILFRGAAEKDIDKKPYSIDLPPIFKIFIESFKWKESLVNQKDYYFLPFLEGGEIFLESWDYQSIFTKPIDYVDDEAEELGLILIATSHRGVFL